MKRIKFISLVLVLSMSSVIFFGCSNGNDKDVVDHKGDTPDKPAPGIIESTGDSITYPLEGDNLTLTYWHSLRAPDYRKRPISRWM